MKSMKLVILYLLLPCVFLFQQSDFEFIYERIEVIEYNTSYVAFAETHNYKYNRTNAASNITLNFKKDFGTEIVVELQAYKFASNEYRYFPIRFMFNLCHYVSRNEFGLGKMLQQCGENTNGCPIRKGWYIMCNWAPNSTKFPPLLHEGRYMFDLKFLYYSNQGLFLQAYGTVKYPELRKRTSFKI